MNDSFTNNELLSLRRFYETGATLTYAFRKQQLQLFKQAVIKYEQEIYDALYKDLKKSPEESYATENGLLLAEINVTLKHLKQWMSPQSTGINLVNLPSSGKLYPDPLGVVLIISPWNYPFQLSLIPFVGAIAAGNCVVLKPSESAPATAAIIEKIIKETFSPEYVKVIQGDGASVIPGMMQAFRFDHIFYTGSIPVGKAIYQLAAKELIPVTLELGGKSPAIVEEDADIAASAQRIALGKFANAGQTCIAPDYVLVHENVLEKFTAVLKDKVTRFFGEDAAKSHDYGRIINSKRFDTLAAYLQDGEIIMGGQTDRAALFIAPTIIKNINQDAKVMQDEIFGPILPIISFKQTEEAIAIVKKNANPLAFYIFTSSKKREEEWIRRVAFGGGCVNNTIWQFANHYMPFGGIGSSGMGAYHGKHSFNTFTHIKPVMKTPTWFDPAIKYPPFKGRLNLFKWLIR
jgi:aldehyde dehydrogenase (NAD+)